MYKTKILNMKEALYVVMIGIFFSVFGALLLFTQAHGQSASGVSVTTTPSPADFTVERPNKAPGSITIENNSNDIIDVRVSKAGSSCNSLAYWAEYPWIEMGAVGLVNPQSSKTVDVAFNSRYLVPGEYSALLCLSNSRGGAEVPTGHLETIPITFTVEDGEGPAVEAVEVAQDRYSIGVEDGIRIPAAALFDDGTRVSIGRYAQWSSADSSIATMNYGWVKGVVAGEVEMTAAFGGKSATATVEVHDGPPQVSVEPESIEVDLMQGTSAQQELTISNIGGSWMDWNITFAKDQDCSDTGTPGKPWLEITGEDEAGSLAPGASAKPRFHVLAYDFYDETEHLAVGEHKGAVCIASDDPEDPLVTVPITLNVEAAPEIDIWSPDWQFYTLPGGGHYVYRVGDGDNMIEISNRGGSTLEWQAYIAGESCDDPIADSWLTLEESQGETEPGDTSYLFFDPHGAREESFELGDYDKLFCITSNDPEQPVVTASLRLSVIEPQDMPIWYLEMVPGWVEPISAGETLQLNATKYVASGHEFIVNEDATWSTSDESVATVDDTGLVTTHAAGEVTITAQYENRSDSITITVEAAAEEPEPPALSIWEKVRAWLLRIVEALWR